MLTNSKNIQNSLVGVLPSLNGLLIVIQSFFFTKFILCDIFMTSQTLFLTIIFPVQVNLGMPHGASRFAGVSIHVHGMMTI